MDRHPGLDLGARFFNHDRMESARHRSGGGPDFCALRSRSPSSGRMRRRHHDLYRTGKTYQALAAAMEIPVQSVIASAAKQSTQRQMDCFAALAMTIHAKVIMLILTGSTCSTCSTCSCDEAAGPRVKSGVTGEGKASGFLLRAASDGADVRCARYPPPAPP